MQPSSRGWPGFAGRHPACAPRSSLFLLLAGGLLLPTAVFLRAEDSPKAAPAEPAKADPAPSPPPRGLDGLKKLPPGVIVIVADDPDQARRLGPNMVWMTQEEYQKYVEQIDQLKAQLKGEKPLPPTACELSGRVEGNVARVRAVFQLETRQPNQLVALGCTQGKPTEVTLDDRLPPLHLAEDGFVVRVEKPGPHVVKMDLDVPLTARGGDRELTLDLPRAALSALKELDLPDGVKDVRVTLHDSSKEPTKTSATLATETLDPKSRRLKVGALGPVHRLELAWKGAAAAPDVQPVLTADGRITVRVGEAFVVTEAEFKLKALRGQASEWRFLLPPGATLLKPLLPDERVKAVQKPDPKGPLQVLTVASGPEPLEVTFRIQQSRTEAALPVGPFVVLNTLTQQGALLVVAPPELRLNYQVRGEPQVAVSQREVTDEERRRVPPPTAAFNYAVMPLPYTLGPAAPPPLPPFLNLEVEQVKGLVGTWTAHTLQLAEPGWTVTTEIDATPLRAGGVDQFQVQLPPGYEYEPRRGPQPPEPGLRIEHDPAGRTLQVFLNPRRSDPFRITLQGHYPAAAAAPPGDGPRQALLELPQPLKTVDRGGQVTVLLPAEMELVPPRPDDPAWAGLVPGRTEHTWRSERMPERAEVAWKPSRPELVVAGVADVTLTARQAQVREALAYHVPQAAGQKLLLWLPESLPPDRVSLTLTQARPAALDENLVLPKKPGFRPWAVALAEPIDRDHPLLLEYAIDLPEPDAAGGPRRFAVPLVVPQQATRTEMKVRVYGGPGVLPSLAEGPGDAWVERPEAGDRDALPALVLRGARPDQPPVLRLSEAGPALAALAVERVLVQATVAEGGAQSYRARFLLAQPAARHLDLEFPAPAAGLNLRVFLRAGDGPPREAWGPPDDGAANGPGAARPDGGRVVRVPLSPDLGRGPVVLDVAYQVPAGRTVASGMLQSTLHAPVLRGDAGNLPVRWQVGLPSDWVPLYPEGGFALEQTWGWRGWLPAPRPAVSDAELERWFSAGAEPAADPGPEAADRASLVCWRGGLEPLHLYHVPQQAWLLVCSLVFLALGLGLYALFTALGRPPAAAAGAERETPAGPRLLVRLLIFGVLLAAALASVLWPGMLAPVLYGCEPGAAVLLLVLAVQWMLHQRYRRQVVFMPGFTRLKSNSSLVRPGSSPPARPRGEPSTVDVPPAAPSGGSGPKSGVGKGS